MQPGLSKIAAALLLGALATSAQAELYAVAPGPHPAGTGHFPAWYQDLHGRALDLCLSRASGPNGEMCVLLPGETFDPAQPLAFPSNFPDEAFWFTGDAAIQDGGIDLTYVSAIEAAFANELPAENDQVSFARIRIRVDVPVPGTYTVTHPYGLEVFEVTAEQFGTDGTRAINMTRDIGIGAPGDFSGALGGDVGPFLRSVNGPYRVFNPETSADEYFIGDPNLLEPVTGSPFGTNYVRVQGPNGIDVRTEVFAISGKLSGETLPTPLVIERSTFSRASGGNGTVLAHQDVFAVAPPPEGSVRFADAGGADIAMSHAGHAGQWYGQSGSEPQLPAVVSVTAENVGAGINSTPTTKSRALVDLVAISQASYSLSRKELTVTASSSDQTALPALSIAGVGTLSGGAVKSITAGMPIPPARVTVSSAHGGSDTEFVVIVD